MRFEMGDKVSRKSVNKTGIVVRAVNPAYLDVYVPHTACVMSWPVAETELRARANYGCVEDDSTEACDYFMD